MPSIIDNSHSCTLSLTSDKVLNGAVVLAEEVVSIEDTTATFSYLKSSDGNYCINVEAQGIAIGEVIAEPITDSPPYYLNAVQVISAFVIGTARTLGIAAKAYEVLSKYHTLISDNEQTDSGASFWKVKMCGQSCLDVRVVLDFRGPNERFLLDTESGQPVLMSKTSTYVDAQVWGWSNYDPRMNPSDYLPFEPSTEEKHFSTVLVATLNLS